MYVQPLETPFSPNSVAPQPENFQEQSAGFQGSLTPGAPGDNISRFAPPWSNPSAPIADGASNSLQGMFGPLMGMLQQLMQMLGSLMGYGCNSPYGGGCQPYGNERYFQNANGSSQGDPHLSFNGAKWNSMASQPDLLNSDSFAGGFQISTQTTPPDGKGVTWNQSATISLNNGATTVGMNSNGDPSITSFGRSVSIASGQTLQLGDGDSVTYEKNGSLLVTAQNGQGGRIDTTLTAQGKGVKVDVTAHDVDLGGALVNGYERKPGPIPEPILTPGPLPFAGPISGIPIIAPNPTTVAPPEPPAFEM